MIEAVNSVLSSSSVTRFVAEQQSTARSLTANPEKVQEAARAPYVSPYISIDRQYNKAVLQIRDSDTGDVVTQYPTEGQLKAYQAAQRASARSERAEITNPDTNSGRDLPVPSASDGGVSAESSAPTVPSVETEA